MREARPIIERYQERSSSSITAIIDTASGTRTVERVFGKMTMQATLLETWIALGRPAEPEEIVAVIAFLASAERFGALRTWSRPMAPR
jgi:NAD(P)-dependent dehydrogenase (short-subunit alcohol dehydrogenase family)